MAFFSQSGLSPLFLLNDYEAPNQYKPRKCPKSYQCSKLQAQSSFAPAFDVREFTNAYYLDGELPGVDQSNIEIEFTDPHTLVIKGHTDREYNNNNDNNDNNDASSSRSSSPAGWHQATVEDEDAESTSSADTAASKTASASASHTEKTETDKPHFWAKERSVGDFQRTFSFTARVDQDSVRASLKNGVLSVVVPKEPTPTPKKIPIL
ncbi:hypothetical protein N7519_001850 [Penicillium mononematosum]|uniref:uncharacterized protein n=1 Tax=Penicillium mononematosum TaxID=268346 RepID=UPI0025466DC7|nr:uncharacterized protein N7519_001850 [Penicillium mononematosum]KAJ6186942.1 hypothetical protein N7519_001850 [Penicillium mononematosum]